MPEPMPRSSFFVAGSWRNRQAVVDVVEALDAMGAQSYSFVRAAYVVEAAAFAVRAARIRRAGMLRASAGCSSRTSPPCAAERSETLYRVFEGMFADPGELVRHLRDHG